MNRSEVMKTYVNTKHLRTLLYNILLWTPGKGEAKKSESSGLVQVSYHGEQISFMSTDGYVVVESGPRMPGPVIHTLVPGHELKEVVRALDGCALEEVSVVHGEDSWTFAGLPPIETVSDVNLPFWGSMNRMMSDTKEDAVIDRWYLDPKRFQKFSLAEPRDTYPLAMQPKIVFSGQPVFEWKYGGDLRGIFAPFIPEDLANRVHPEDEGTILWPETIRDYRQGRK